MSKLKYIKTILVLLLKVYLVYLWINFVETFTQLLYNIYVLKVYSLEYFGLFLFFLFGVNVNIRMYNFDDVQCTVIPSVAYGFVTGMNLQLC